MAQCARNTNLNKKNGANKFHSVYLRQQIISKNAQSLSAVKTLSFCLRDLHGNITAYCPFGTRLTGFSGVLSACGLRQKCRLRVSLLRLLNAIFCKLRPAIYLPEYINTLLFICQDFFNFVLFLMPTRPYRESALTHSRAIQV